MSRGNQWINGRKICPRCSEEKDESGYYRCGNGLFMSWCKACCKRLRPQNTAYFKKYYLKNKEHRRETDRERRYGVSKELFDFVFNAQGQKCGICGTRDSGKNHWHVDHDHATGQFRGVLCTHCNGIVTEHGTKETLLKAISYLEQTKVVEVK